jgi:hypothetical protein
VTSDQAIDIAVRLGTAIMALEAALPLTTIEDGATAHREIVMALRRARRGLAAINALLARQEYARTLERQIIDKANRR